MKSVTSMATPAYESPETLVLEIHGQGLVCMSPTAGGNEKYVEEDTSEWYNN